MRYKPHTHTYRPAQTETHTRKPPALIRYRPPEREESHVLLWPLMFGFVVSDWNFIQVWKLEDTGQSHINTAFHRLQLQYTFSTFLHASYLSAPGPSLLGKFV